MTAIENRKRRLRLVLFAAAALGSTSASLGGVLTALMIQHPASHSRSA